MGNTTGIPVNSLKRAGQITTTGRIAYCLLPNVGSRLTSQISPRCPTAAQCQQVGHKPSAVPVVGRSGLVALRKKFVEGVAGPSSRCHHQATLLNRNLHPSTGSRLQHVERSRRHCEHDRAADPA